MALIYNKQNKHKYRSYQGGSVIAAQTNIYAMDANTIPTGGSSSGMSSQAAVQMGASAVTMASSALTADAGIDYDNLDKSVDKGAMVGGAVASGAASGAAAGFAVGGPWGAAAGAVIGGISSGIGASKQAKEDEKRRKDLVQKRDMGAMRDKQVENANTFMGISQSANSKYGADGRTRVLGEGGSFSVISVKFKLGGTMTEASNIIPNGVSHEEKNSMGTKGMPVVKCKKEVCQKVYEIESDEMIFTKRNTKKIEELAYGGKLEDLGTFVLNQILHNTYSYTDSYKRLNK